MIMVCIAILVNKTSIYHNTLAINNIQPTPHKIYIQEILISIKLACNFGVFCLFLSIFVANYMQEYMQVNLAMKAYDNNKALFR